MKDFCVQKDIVILENDIDIVIQQIDVLLDTEPRENLGDPTCGSDCEQFLWDLNYSNSYIERYISGLISNRVNLMGFALSVKVTILQGTEHDIILVTIALYRDGYQYQKVYNIEEKNF